MKAMDYVVIWNWRFEIESSSQKRDEVRATNAQRAINKVKTALAAEYADVSSQFVPLEVVRV
jgi:hypothetical protein